MHEHPLAAGDRVHWRLQVAKAGSKELTIDVTVFWRESGVHAKQGDGEIVRPMERCCACEGSWGCRPCKGALVFVLDNQFSWATNKDVTLTTVTSREQPVPGPEPGAGTPMTAPACGAPLDPAREAGLAQGRQLMQQAAGQGGRVATAAPAGDITRAAAAATTTQGEGEVVLSLADKLDGLCHDDEGALYAAASAPARPLGTGSLPITEAEEDNADSLALAKSAALLASLRVLEAEVAAHIPDDTAAVAQVQEWTATLRRLRYHDLRVQLIGHARNNM